MNNIRLTTSATQIDQWLMCKRKWVAAYLLGIKQPQTEAMAFGEVGHKYLEVYNRTGKVPDENKPWQFTKESPIRYPGKSAKKALKYIPSPHTGRPEHGFKFVIKGIEFIGYIDLEWSNEHGLWVTDYKFTSGFDNAMDSSTLAANVQATIYSTKAMLEHKVKEVNLKWIYILSTTKPSARPVISKLTEEQTKTQLKTLLSLCEEMIQCKNTLENKWGIYNEYKGLSFLPEEIKNDIINSIEPTVESCSRFNGCYYCDRCQLTEEQLIEGDMNDMDKDMESKLKSMGLDQFIKPEKKPVQETKAEAKETVRTHNTPTEHIKQEKKSVEKAKQEAKEKGTRQLNLDYFLKQPVVHTDKPKEKREEPKVQLNAPENYVEDVKHMPIEAKVTVKTEDVETSIDTRSCCSGGFSLTDKEKTVIKGIIDRL